MMLRSSPFLPCCMPTRQLLWRRQNFCLASAAPQQHANPAVWADDDGVGPQQVAADEADSQRLAPAPGRGRRRKPKAEPGSPDGSPVPEAEAKKKRSRSKLGTRPASDPLPELAVQLQVGAHVLPRAAAVIRNLILDHGFGSVHELMVDRGVSHATALEHLLTLLDLGELDEGTLLKLHDLHLGPPLGLTLGIIQQALKEVGSPRGSGISKDDAVLAHLREQHAEAVQAQESRHAGIMPMQLRLVKQLVKRRAKNAPATVAGTSLQQSHPSDPSGMPASQPSSSADPPQQVLSKADLVRVKAYVAGRTLEEIQQPPFSRKAVQRASALGSLVSACKAGVQLPLDRLLADFKLNNGPGGLTPTEVAVALSRVLHQLNQGLRGTSFYEFARMALLQLDAFTKANVEQQEASDPMGKALTVQQVRLVYYLILGGQIPKPPAWLVREQREREHGG